MSNRRQQLALRRASLGRKLIQQLTSPASFLLAGGFGFILGEVSQAQISNKAPNHEAVPVAFLLRTTLRFLSSAKTLYAALPIAWLTQFFRHRIKLPNHEHFHKANRRFHKGFKAATNHRSSSS